jgi:hypothetical protein
MPGRGGRSSPPRPVVAMGIHLDISGGKIVESRSNWDTPGMLQQIGTVPATERQAGS